MEAFMKEIQHLKIELEEIKSATGNFHNKNLIGKGGFGMVYQGVLSHSTGQTKFAFKRLDRRFGQGDPEFLKEIIMLFRYTHENLISLTGFCDQDGEKILVYEHASHGSLDNHLSSTTLTWRRRLKICLGAAKGLCYLHDPKGTQQRVVHRDIKSSNILLDSNWNAKVSDMGLSKMGPDNQHYLFLATNVVGTPGYIDPLYMETYSLTKESDVYSFGLVLFETSPIDVVGDLEKTGQRCPKLWKNLRLHFSFRRWNDQRTMEITRDSWLMGAKRIKPTNLRSFNGQWLWLSKNGQQCEMISAEECLIPTVSAFPMHGYDGGMKSRFQVNRHKEFYNKFKTHVITQFLSPNITYAVNLVFDINYAKMTYLFLNYELAGERKPATSNVLDKREDGWFTTELYQFSSDGGSIDLEITFDCSNPIMVEGIEFQPVDRDEVLLEDEEVHTQTDAYWVQKLPSDYLDIITQSKDGVQWTSKKELYSILCKGFPIKNGEEWFSLGINGRKCHMLSAKAVLRKGQWKWRPSPESRFKEVALNSTGSFYVTCSSEMLSPQTRYACYLVYKTNIVHKDFPHYVTVTSRLKHDGSEDFHIENILLTLCETPIIRRNLNDNTPNPSKRTRMKGIPQHRDDGWIEVQVWESKTGTTTSKITLLDLAFHSRS